MCDGGTDRADDGANQQRQVRRPRQRKSAAAALRRLCERLSKDLGARELKAA